ncbi:MAG TPA: TetR/AcrR family transcriptional regulator [Ensifer sp.]|jgi:AcrR family transcriptional regulator|uniref:TetR/AcrR family transcriptional regulator n=1 Tax=Ensifer sp. TaxID=1872086 RepID=UPI002E1020F6|nr:TetR/AcrR family transcriptional regulator [Ensifer sp.]
MTKRETARDRILTAAEAIVVGKGVSSLTFDEVAEQTGLSKGGILYHFASKDALVRAMVERFVFRFETGLSGLETEDEDPHGRYTRAYVRATLGEATSTGDQYDRLGASITAALSNFPDLLEIVRQQNIRCQAAVENDGLDPVEATITRLAVEGMWLAEVFNVMHLDPEMKRAVTARLLERTHAPPSPK